MLFADGNMTTPAEEVSFKITLLSSGRLKLETRRFENSYLNVMQVGSHLSDERGNPDDNENVAAMELAEHVDGQIKSSSTQLVTQNHHHERVEDERVVNSWNTSKVVRPTRLNS